jgi:protein SCO1/2
MKALALFTFLFLSPHPALAKVEVQNRQGSYVNAPDYPFQDESGAKITLGNYFNRDKPVVLSFVYFECPGACSVLLNAEIEALTPHILIPGRDFELVIISINPNDTSSLAMKKKETYLKKYGRPDSRDGWHFLTGDADTIERITRRLGFYYEYDSASGEYNHPSAVFFLTPDQVLSGVQTGLRFDPALFRAAIVDARFKRMGGFIQRLNAVCYTFLPHVGPLDRPSRWSFVLLGLISLLAFGLTRFLSKI